MKGKTKFRIWTWNVQYRLYKGKEKYMSLEEN